MQSTNLLARMAMAACLVTISAPAALAETLILSTNTAPGHFSVQHGLEPFMQCVTGRSNGGIDFNFFPSAQIASLAGALDAMNDGLAQVAYLAVSGLSDKLPLANITMLPDMGDNVAQMVQAWRKVLADGGPLADELAANNIVPLLVHMYPPYQLGLRGEPITSLEEFSGVKVRVSGGSQVFAVNSLGAVPVQIAAADAYVAMQQGTIDGYMLALTSIQSYSLEEISKAISTNANFAGAAAFVAMDSRVFSALSAENQKALTDCGAEVEASLTTFQDNLVKELETEFAAAGVAMYQIPDEALAAINDKLKLAAEDYIARLTGLGLPAQAAHDQYRAALGK